jgi:predicted permease
MRVHLDVLGWLYVLVGGLGVCLGAALCFLAVGTAATLFGEADRVGGLSDPVVWLLSLAGVALAAGAGGMIVVGRALARRQSSGRAMALVAASLNLALLPFGTALAIYTFWTLLNDEARREFGRPARASG